MSEIKVNKISPRSGTGVQLGDSGDTITIPSGATFAGTQNISNSALTGSGHMKYHFHLQQVLQLNLLYL
jgi:hypothetical protein